MIGYPAWWSKTITVYNKYEAADGTITWYSTVLTDSFIKHKGERVVLGDVEVVTDYTICRIPKSTNFAEKYEWDLAPTGKFTLAPGDIIVFAGVSDTVDEYTAGKHSTDLLNKYKKAQGAMVIESVNINVGPGLGIEHYHVKGV